MAIVGPEVAKSGEMTERKIPRITNPATTRNTVRGFALIQRLTADNTPFQIVAGG
jgi:hypothetical protein